jgi:FtsZ-binding cell division protein ZapB
MSEEYITMQNMIEQLNKESIYWRKMVVSEAHHYIHLKAEIELLTSDLNSIKAENELLTNDLNSLKTENEEYNRLNARIWDQTKTWIKQDSDIISRQAAQIKFLAGRIKALEKK